MNVLSLFDGMSCGRLALTKLGIKVDNYYASEIKKYAIKTTQHNFPDTIQLGDVKNIDAKSLPPIDLLIGGSPCFVPGTQVTTNEGYKSIEEIEVGDKVITHKGRYKKVLRVGGKPNQAVVLLEAEGVIPTYVTLDHPYYTIEKKADGYTKPQWKTVSDLDENSYIGIPLSIFSGSKAEHYVSNGIVWTSVKVYSEKSFSNVYNIEVDTDNSYTANNAIVHNCQDFSQANRIRLGDQGTKSSLFWEYIRILDELRIKNPDVKFMLENVKMKPEHNKIVTDSLGVSPVNINSKLVSAQLRNRYYWTNISDRIVQPSECFEFLQDILEYGWTERDKSRALLESDCRSMVHSYTKMFHRHYAKGFNTLIFKDMDHYYACKNHYDQNFKGMKGSDIFDNSELYHGVRYLTRLERERLQGVPEGYTDVVSKSNAACMLGDGWNVPTIEHIFKYL